MDNSHSGMTLQINHAETQRNAARDFHEMRASLSIKAFLALTPQAEIDRLTLENRGRLFRHRFGFDAPRRHVRAQVLALQEQFEYTDRDIRWLKYSGQLRVTRDEAKLQPSRLMSIAGMFQLAIVVMVGLLCVARISFSPSSLWKQTLGEWAVLAICFGAAWWLNELHLEPWRLVRHVKKSHCN